MSVTVQSKEHFTKNVHVLLLYDTCIASFPGLPTVQFLIACSFLLHTASDQKLDGGKAWERV